MKKMYQQPKMGISHVVPMKIVCTSTGYGGGTDELGTGGGKTTGEAPKRRTPVF